MKPETRGRRLLAALADATPAFTASGNDSARWVRRLLAALADARPPAKNRCVSPDAYTSESRPEMYVLLAVGAYGNALFTEPPAERINLRRELPIGRLLTLQAHADTTRETATLDEHHLLIEALLTGLPSPVPRFDVLIAGAVEQGLATAKAATMAHDGTRDLVRARARRLVTRLPLAVLEGNHAVLTALKMELHRVARRSHAYDSTVSGAAIRKFAATLAMGLRLITSALADFTHADLSSVDLRDVDLDGVQWSEETRWPPGWEDRVRRISTEIAPGTYEIHSELPPVSAFR